MDGKERKRRDKPSQNQGEGEGPRKGKEEIPNEPPQAMGEDVEEMLEEVRARIMSKANEVEDAFNRAIEDLTRFKQYLVTLAEEKYVENADNIRAFARAIDEIINYVVNVKQWYIDKAYPEVMELINRGVIRRRKTTLSIVGEYATVLLHNINGSKVIEIIIKKRHGAYVVTPPILPERLRLSIMLGLLNSDGHVNKRGHATMTTVYLWQVISWLIYVPGENYLKINIELSAKKGAKLVWSLVNQDSIMSLIRPVIDGIINGEVVISWPLLVFGAVLGDGYINIRYRGTKKELTIGVVGKDLSYLPEWLFSSRLDEEVVAYGSHAVFLLRTIYNELDPILLDILRFMADFSDAEKLRRFFKAINMQFRPHGEYSIQILQWNFTVKVRAVHGKRLWLVRAFSSREEAEGVVRELNDYFNSQGIPAKAKVTGTKVMLGTTDIRRLLGKLINVNDLLHILCQRRLKSNDEKKAAIEYYIMEFAPTKGAAAALFRSWYCRE